MTDPQDNLDGDSLGDNSLDDDSLDHVLDRGFQAAGEAAKRDDASPAPSVIQRIGAITGAKPSISLREVDPAGQTPMLKPLLASDGMARETGKYMVQGMLGQGGVGAVHRGHDSDLGRDVAMKFLHEKYKDTPEVLHRFVEEAQIGGQLQHPGIVPVYELGMSDGRPFFTMKMVKGQTLAQALSDRKSPADDRRHFLSIFEQICQTMAYAHARGVVHRDLKPANIMIGSFGEVQVVDWGMGKVLERGGVADEKRAAELQSRMSIIETVRSSGHGTQSIMGSVMGTPAYMPPEQARGDVEAMDARSDVFALGAILCEILTGQPPYVGDTSALISMAAMAKLDDALRRLAESGADGDLVELTIECLMPAPAARPQSAEAVASRIHDHLGAAEARAHDATVRAAALKRTQKLGIALTAVIAVGLAASLWFWRDADTQRGIAEQAAADAKEAEGRERTARATAETNLENFNRLSYVVRLETAKTHEQALHPAWPVHSQAMQDWLEGDAKELQDAVPALRSTLASLETRATPQTEEEKAHDLATHPHAAELTRLEAKLAALRSAQAVRAGGAAPEPFALDPVGLPESYRDLTHLALTYVSPDREVFGREAEGLALARHAATLASVAQDDRWVILDAIATALFALGLDAEALEQCQAALDAAPPGSRHERQILELQELEAAVEAASGPEAQTAMDELAAEVTALRTTVNQRHTWTFSDTTDQFLHDTLSQLVADIESFTVTEAAAVTERLRWAERVEELTVTRHASKWAAARSAILAADGVTASTRYAAKRFELQPQLGLIPMGMNPRTKLWEFYHLRSAWDPAQPTDTAQPIDPALLDPPTYDEHGKLDMDGRGIVFVLIPGGPFSMGGQSYDPTDPNYYFETDVDEKPVHHVELDPYFLAKHELTQGQWSRLTGGDSPSFYQRGIQYSGNPEPVRDSNPVERVNWMDCTTMLSRFELLLPTEAQWENACRAGTSTAWSSGSEPYSLDGHANVLDLTGEHSPPHWPGGETFDDHFKGPAPVATYAANPFGLHDMHGNVAEWCQDWLATYKLPTRTGDALRQTLLPPNSRACRGGSYLDAAASVRTSYRHSTLPGTRVNTLGVRVARRVMR